MSRPLTERQRVALKLCFQGFVNARTERSMDSLIARGLVIREYDRFRRRTGNYHVTEVGRRTVEELGE